MKGTCNDVDGGEDGIAIQISRAYHCVQKRRGGAGTRLSEQRVDTQTDTFAAREKRTCGTAQEECGTVQHQQIPKSIIGYYQLLFWW